MRLLLVFIVLLSGCGSMKTHEDADVTGLTATAVCTGADVECSVRITGKTTSNEKGKDIELDKPSGE